MNIKSMTFLTVSCLFFSLLGSCRSIPENTRPIENFDAKKYLGTWYEIARFDYRFERDMDNVIAQYSLNSNGGIRVFNSGYNYKKGEWKSAEGHAKFRVNEKTGALMVSFFEPFYAAYNIIALDENYNYALVAGKNLKYLWFLSREKTMPDDIKQYYLQIATEIGYDTSNLIWVKHDRQSPFLNEK